MYQLLLLLLLLLRFCSLSPLRRPITRHNNARCLFIHSFPFIIVFCRWHFDC